MQGHTEKTRWAGGRGVRPEPLLGLPLGRILLAQVPRLHSGKSHGTGCRQEGQGWRAAVGGGIGMGEHAYVSRVGMTHFSRKADDKNQASYTCISNIMAGAGFHR